MYILIAALTSAISLSFFKGGALFLSSDLLNEYFMTFLPGSLNWQLAIEAVAAGLRSAKGVQSAQNGILMKIVGRLKKSRFYYGKIYSAEGIKCV
ncbi:hypothetical protein V2P20_05720 [Methylobacter sp. Wu1]|uniref:hypothetical protein n=1 Tax=Methylobacter sp. Wu1 TaxID=3119359 RepID=UPI002F94C9DE